MAYTSEIEKLERRYAENPQGRNFAPLADAYRKAGQLDQAVELCRSGLERHPDYVSAHIVLGRCLLDKKSDGEAEQIFRRVLDLDGENVIAFKVLADIGTRGGRFDETVTWLTRLLAADPMNGDAAEALATAKRKAAQAPKAPPPPPPPPREPAAEPVVRVVPEAVTAAMEQPVLVVEPASMRAPVGASTSEPTPPGITSEPASDIEIFDGTLNFNAVAHAAAKTEGLEIQEEVKMEPTPVVVEGLAQTQYEASGIFRLDTAPGAPATESAPVPEAELEDLPTVDLPLIMPDDVAAPGTRRTPPPPAPVVSPAPPARVEGPPPGRPSAPLAAAVALSDDDGAADTAALSRAEPVLTETMAELYLKQGHEEEARRVYDALLQQRPGDGRLRARWQELFGGGMHHASHGETVRSFLKGILTRRPGEPSPPPPVGSPLDSAFAHTSEGEIPGAPTRAAGDSISLDEVFGVEAIPAVTSGSGPVADPPPPGGSAEPKGKETASGGFSFDEFFAAKGAPEAAPAPEGAKGPARASGARPKPQGEEDVDLDQFQSWLKGLKS